MSQHEFPSCERLGAYVRQDRPSHESYETKPLGRPKTRTPEHFKALLEEHARVVVWFEQVHGRPPKSDVELLTAYLVSHFTSLGLRASRAQSGELQRNFKTIRNELAIARKMAKGGGNNESMLGKTNNGARHEISA